MTDKRKLRNDDRVRFPGNRDLCLIGLFALSLAVFSLTGCGRPATPARNELVELLGDLESDVLVLGSELQTRPSNPDNSASPNLAAENKVTKLWVVRSNNALPAPRPQTEPQIRTDQPATKVLYKADAYSARVLYDVASALRVRESELPIPNQQKWENARGRLTEWSKSSWSIRIRDYHAETGWLSVVEAIPE